jgi:hypothetical protein
MTDPRTNRLKRRLTSPDSFDFFTSSAASFHPRPYQPNVSVAPPPKPPPPARNNSLTHPLPPMDPTPGEPNTVFIHPPFFDFPDSHLYPDGLTYTVMAINPDWFLDPADFISMHTSTLNAIPYPPQLEPPRGWCPAKKKDLKERGADGWPDGEEPRLRCTFCRRTYAGVNAKSMWRRHVFEKHKIAMSNRRENAERSRKGSRMCYTLPGFGLRSLTKQIRKVVRRRRICWSPNVAALLTILKSQNPGCGLFDLLPRRARRPCQKGKMIMNMM